LLEKGNRSLNYPVSGTQNLGYGFDVTKGTCELAYVRLPAVSEYYFRHPKNDFRDKYPKTYAIFVVLTATIGKNQVIFAVSAMLTSKYVTISRYSRK